MTQPKLTIEGFNKTWEHLTRLHDAYADNTTPIGIAPCDIGPDDVLTVDFTAPLTDRIVKVERDGVVIYEALNERQTI